MFYKKTQCFKKADNNKIPSANHAEMYIIQKTLKDNTVNKSTVFVLKIPLEILA